MNGLFVEQVVPMQTDGASHLPVEARVEEPCGIGQGRAVGESEFDLVPVGLTGADHAVIGPRRDACRVRRLLPLRFFDRVWRRLLDQHSHAMEALTAPICRGCRMYVGLVHQ